MISVPSLQKALRKVSFLARQHLMWIPKMEVDSDFQLPFLDRVSKLIIGSAHFERCYRQAIVKYARSGNLKNFSLDFSITNGSFLADPYADGELADDGMLRVFWRNRRMTTRPAVSVRWVFGMENGMEKCWSQSSYQNPCFEGDHSPTIPTTVSQSITIGHILDHNGSIIYKLRSLSIHHRYTIYHHSDHTPFMEIKGESNLKMWTAKASGMASSSLIFRFFDSRNRLLAILEPIIDDSIFSTNSNHGLMLVKYTRKCESREMKAVILGASLLLCQKYYMKKLHHAFQDAATKNINILDLAKC